MVPQKPFLFDITVQENIEIGKSKYSRISVEDATRFSNSLDFIEIDSQINLMKNWGKKPLEFQVDSYKD